MDMAFTSFENRFSARQRHGGDFPALVALLAADQSSRPTARLAARMEKGGDRQFAAIDALIALFAPLPGEAVHGGVLRGSFNPAVPNSHIALTKREPW